MTVACGTLWGLTGLAWVYWGLTLVAAWRFRQCRPPSSNPTVPVTVLKPLCGLEWGLRDNLASFLDQDYPAYQVVFVAEDAEDPALEIARSVVVEHPGVDAVTVGGGTAAGSNRKVANLVRGMACAKHELIVISDSDMRVGRDYLRTIAAPFEDRTVGVVTCLYRGTEPHSIGARFEALHIGLGFIPSVLVGWLFMGCGFGFGSTLAVRRDALHGAGGFEALLNELADDYRLVENVRRSGFRSALSTYVVDCVLGRVPFGTMLSRRLRWARTVRSLRPWGYFGALITHGTPLAILLGLLCGETAARWFALATLAARLAVGPVTALLGARDPAGLRNPVLVWVNDCLEAMVWICSWFGGHVRWRGRSVPLKHTGE